MCVTSDLTLDGLTVGVVGGGRWGRVILGCLDRVLPIDVGVWVVTPRNAEDTSRWLSSRGWARRWGVAEGLSRVTASSPSLVLVANQAGEHVRSAQAALSLGHRVLCEKPIAVNADEAERLVGRARSLQRPVWSSNVFLFASYLRTFGHEVARYGVPHRISIDWADPRSEVRYGEAKRFDRSVDVIADILPHIVSILSVLGVDDSGAWRVVRVTRGGAEVVLEMSGDRVVVRIRLERNARQRRRSVTADVDAGRLHLDFAEEPGLITDHEGGVAPACSGWDRLPSPMSQLLETAWRQHEEGSFDQRLTSRHALRACHLHEDLLDRYERLRGESLRQLTRDSPGSLDFRYGCEEIEWIQARNPTWAEVSE